MKGLSQSVVRANSARLLFVKWLEGADQKHNRNVPELLVLFDVIANFVATDQRHEHIRKDHVRQKLFQPLNRLASVVDANYLYAFVGKGKSDNFLNRD